MKRMRSLFFIMLGLIAAGCQRTAPPPAAKSSSLSKEEYLVGERPSGAKDILGLRGDKAAALQDGEEIVVAGRIGGSQKPFTGRASFTIVDMTLKPCDEAEGCPTPWDYCCEPVEDLAKATLLVKITDEQGRTLGDDAEQALGLRPGQSVVVRGAAQKAEDGRITAVHAKAIFAEPKH